MTKSAITLTHSLSITQCLPTISKVDAARPAYQCTAHSDAIYGKYQVTFNFTLPTEKIHKKKIAYVTTSSRTYNSSKKKSITIDLDPREDKRFNLIFDKLEFTQAKMGFGDEVIENIVGDLEWTIDVKSSL